MKRFLQYLRYLRWITSGFHQVVILRTLLGIIRVALMLLFIWLSKTAIDCAIGKDAVGEHSLTFWFVLMVIDLLLDVVVARGVQYIEARSVMQMNNRVNRRLFNRLMIMPFVNGRQGFHSGDMLERLTTDVRTLSGFSLVQLPSVVVMGVQLVGAFIFLATMSPVLALAPLIITPVCILVSKLYFKRQRNLTARVREAQSDVLVSIQEGLKHRMVLRSLDCVDEMDHRLADVLYRLDDSNRRQTRLSVASGAMVRLGFLAGYLTAFGWSIYGLQAGLITYGTMTAFIQLVARIQNPIAGLSSYIPTFISTSVAIDRLREIEDGSETKNEAEDAKMVDGMILSHPGIRIKNLFFQY